MERKFLQIHSLGSYSAIADLAVAYLEKKQANADQLTYLFSTTYTEEEVATANSIGVMRREHAKKKRAGGIKANPDDTVAGKYELEGVLGELLTQRLFEATTEYPVEFAPLYSENRKDFSKPDMVLGATKYDTKTASKDYSNLAININGHSQSLHTHGIGYYIAIWFSSPGVADWFVVKAGAVDNWEVKQLWRAGAPPFYRAPFPALVSSF